VWWWLLLFVEAWVVHATPLRLALWQALEAFNAALDVMPSHQGFLGRGSAHALSRNVSAAA
jgi:hypothetical protein